MKRHALIASINKYPLLRNLQGKPLHLKNPAEDGEAIAQLLEKPTDDFAWIVERLPEKFQSGKLLVDPLRSVSEDGLSKAIHHLLYPDVRYVTDDCVVLLFFAGHSLRKQHQDGTFEIFLATSDADGKKEWGVSLNWLHDELIHSPIKKQVVWLDCCPSGELLNFLPKEELEYWLEGSDSRALTPTADRCLIISALSGSDGRTVEKHGVLTQVLLQALDPIKHPAGKLIDSSTVIDLVEKQLENQIYLCQNSGEIIYFWQGEKSGD
jgi:hypothetical protein